MRNRSSRRRFPTLSLLLGLSLLVASPLGWAWLQYVLHREEADALEELRRAGIDCYVEHDVFLAKPPGEASEGMWDIMSERWRGDFDIAFPWLRPLRRVIVRERVSLELAQRIASLPRIQEVTFVPAPEGAPLGPTPAEVGFDFDDLAKKDLVATDLDQPIPTGRTLVGDDRQELESRLRDAWEGRGETPIASRYAVSFAVRPGPFAGRSIVDSDRRKFIMSWPERLDTAIRSNGTWRGVTRDSPDRTLALHELPEGPFWYADYEAYPPYVQPEFPGYGEPLAPPSALLAAGIEYAEKLSDGAYAIRFRPFDAEGQMTNGRRHPSGGWDRVQVETMTVVVRPDLDWCVQRGEIEFAGTRRVDWMNKLDRHGDDVIVREQLYRPSNTLTSAAAGVAGQTSHAVFDWDLIPKLAPDEFSLASAGAGPLGPPRPIPWYRHWYFATAVIGAPLTAYALLRILARRLLRRRELRLESARRAEMNSA